MHHTDTLEKLLHAAIDYDRKQSRKRGYNPHAMGHYARALGYVRRHVAAGHAIRDAVVNCFIGPLCDVLLKAAGLALMTDSEARHGLLPRLPELADE